MGIYASNNYNLTIPVAAIEAIFAEFEPYQWSTETLTPTPKGLVEVIGYEFGAEDDINFYVADGNVTILAFSYGKIGETDRLGGVLARHGATGIIHGEVDGDFCLLEFTDGEVKVHPGQIVYPGYKGSLLP